MTAVTATRFSLAEDHPLGELGFLGPDDRVELIRPEIIIKAVKSTLARARAQYLGSVEKVRFQYALMLGSLTTETYLKLMEWQTQISHNYG